MQPSGISVMNVFAGSIAVRCYGGCHLAFAHGDAGSDGATRCKRRLTYAGE